MEIAERFRGLSELLRGGIWKLFGGLLLISVVLLIFAIIISGVVGIINVGPLLIIGLVLVLVLIGASAIVEPSNIPAYISGIIQSPFSNRTNSTDEPAYNQPSEQSTPSPEDSFDRLVEVADEESTELADLLRGIRAEFDDITCDDIAEILAAGVEAQNNPPGKQVLQQLKTYLDARDFVEESDSLTLRVIQSENGILYARLSDDHGQPKVGLEFDLYIEEVAYNQGEVEQVPIPVGKARVINIESEFCAVEIISWNDRVNGEIENRMDYIMEHNPTLQFNEDAISDVEWEELEQAHESLERIALDGGTHYAR